MTLKYLHYCTEPLQDICKISYINSEDISNFRGYYKPSGLWFSVEGLEDDITWMDFCKESEWEDKLKYCYEIQFTEDANILHLDNSSDILEFTKKYVIYSSKKQEDISIKINEISYNLRSKKEYDPIKSTSITQEEYIELTNPLNTINWQLISQTYDGIVIAPYDWTLRTHPLTFWYYGWDCASGCIWHLDKIKSFKKKINK